MPKRVDELGDRMKSYEAVTKTSLPRRSYTILRCDGRAFHSFTRGLKRPFDESFAADMDATAVALCAEIDGAVAGYVQSDEVSVVMTDFATPSTQAWFDGEVQKITSIAAAVATSAFNQARTARLESIEEIRAARQGLFDARVFTVPDLDEVEAYLIWRQRDAVRNSISMAAQSEFSHRELQGVGANQMQEMLFQRGVNWNDYPVAFKRGRLVQRISEPGVVTYTRKDSGEEITQEVVRSRWVAAGAPRFTRNGELRAILPERPGIPERSFG